MFRKMAEDNVDEFTSSRIAAMAKAVASWEVISAELPNHFSAIGRARVRRFC